MKTRMEKKETKEHNEQTGEQTTKRETKEYNERTEREKRTNRQGWRIET